MSRITSNSSISEKLLWLVWSWICTLYIYKIYVCVCIYIYMMPKCDSRGTWLLCWLEYAPLSFYMWFHPYLCFRLGWSHMLLTHALCACLVPAYACVDWTRALGSHSKYTRRLCQKQKSKPQKPVNEVTQGQSRLQISGPQILFLNAVGPYTGRLPSLCRIYSCIQHPLSLFTRSPIYGARHCTGHLFFLLLFGC